MKGATGHSFDRLHRGYHYPRSPATGLESRMAETLFRKEYEEAVFDMGQKLYVIGDGSKIGGEAYSEFLDREGLEANLWMGHPLVPDAHWVFEVAEPRILVSELTEIIGLKLHQNGVRLHLGDSQPGVTRDGFDQIVVAAYSNTHEVLRGLGLPQQEYRFQLVEKLFVKMPKTFHDVSIVVIDGPFGCLDPHGSTQHHILGHVTETILDSRVCSRYVPPRGYKPHLESGRIVKRKDTRFGRVVESLEKYIPALRDGEYQGSSLVVRAVLAGQEETDARPTLVDRLDHQVIRIFSGKLGTAVDAAKQAVSLVRSRNVKAA
jgi:hypothetical protein